MKPIFAPIARPAMIVPSMMECGSCRKMRWSLQVPGSDSSPLTSTYFGCWLCLGTNDHFSPVGEAGAAASAQAGGLHLADDPLGGLPEALPQRLVSAKLDILVDVGRALAKAEGEQSHFIGMGDKFGHQSAPSFVLRLSRRIRRGPCPSFPGSGFRGSHS